MAFEHILIQNANLVVGFKIPKVLQCSFLRDEPLYIHIDGVDYPVVSNSSFHIVIITP